VRNPVSRSQFERDVKRVQKRGKDLAKLRDVILLLVEEKSLPPHYKDHALMGEWKQFRDCHIEPGLAADLQDRWRRPPSRAYRKPFGSVLKYASCLDIFSRPPQGDPANSTPFASR